MLKGLVCPQVLSQLHPQHSLGLEAMYPAQQLSKLSVWGGEMDRQAMLQALSNPPNNLHCGSCCLQLDCDMSLQGVWQKHPFFSCWTHWTPCMFTRFPCMMCTCGMSRDAHSPDRLRSQLDALLQLGDCLIHITCRALPTTSQASARHR